MSLVLTYLDSPRDRKAYDTCYRIDALTVSMTTVRDVFLLVYPDLKVIVFHEDYDEEDQYYLASILPCEFHEVDFSVLPDGGNPATWNKRNPGYLMMCRFFSGIMQQHEALKGFTHYMRLDDDSYFINPKITRDAVDRMLSADYAYRQIFWDDHGHDGLYEFTVDFLKNEELDIPENGLLKDGKYEGKAIYNNFHIASLKFWQHSLIKKYTDLLEKENLILKRGWLDANIHTMIVALLGPHVGIKVCQELSFGYRHNFGKALVNSAWEWVPDGCDKIFVAKEEERS